MKHDTEIKKSFFRIANIDHVLSSVSIIYNSKFIFISKFIQNVSSPKIVTILQFCMHINIHINLKLKLKLKQKHGTERRIFQ